MTYRFGRGARTGALLRRPSGVASTGVALPTTDLLFAFFADQGVTTVGGGGGDANEVTAWADQGAGSGPHDVTQASATDRPEYDATGGPGGVPAIAFGAQSTDATGNLEFGGDVTTVAGGHTFYLVLNQITTASFTGVLDFRTGREYLYTGATVRLNDGTDRVLGSGATGWQCLTVQTDDTACRGWRARASLGADQGWGGNNALQTPANLGANSFGTAPFNGLIAACLGYDAVHDATQREAVWAYLETLYPSVF